MSETLLLLLHFIDEGMDANAVFLMLVCTMYVLFVNSYASPLSFLTFFFFDKSLNPKCKQLNLWPRPALVDKLTLQSFEVGEKSCLPLFFDVHCMLEQRKEKKG